MRTTAEGPRPIVLGEIWRRYERTQDREARDQLILAYSPIVKYAAGQTASRMPPHIELADLISYGLGGLLEAVERFEPARGVRFEVYAATRIRGAILDELRSLDWVPRRVRREARNIEAATVEHR
jgi:RNA polymerase sigma factor for flagellar operon FliA